MSRSLTASDRKNLIRLASTLPAGSAERRAILAGLSKQAWSPARTDAEVFANGNMNARLLVRKVDKMVDGLGSLMGFPDQIGVKAAKARLALIELAREIGQYD